MIVTIRVEAQGNAVERTLTLGPPFDIQGMSMAAERLARLAEEINKEFEGPK